MILLRHHSNRVLRKCLKHSYGFLKWFVVFNQRFDVSEKEQHLFISVCTTGVLQAFEYMYGIDWNDHGHIIHIHISNNFYLIHVFDSLFFSLCPSLSGCIVYVCHMTIKGTLSCFGSWIGSQCHSNPLLGQDPVTL